MRPNCLLKERIREDLLTETLWQMSSKAIAKKLSLAGNYKTENVIIEEMSRKELQIILETVRF